MPFYIALQFSQSVSQSIEAFTSIGTIPHSRSQLPTYNIALIKVPNINRANPCPFVSSFNSPRSFTHPIPSLPPNQRSQQMSPLWPQAAFILSIILIRFLIQRYNRSQPKAVAPTGQKSKSN